MKPTAEDTGRIAKGRENTAMTIDRRAILRGLAASSTAGLVLGGGARPAVAKPIGTYGQLQLAATSTAPEVAWTYSRGDTSIDRAYAAVETIDGFVFAGRKTVSGIPNIWVVKGTRHESTDDFQVLWDETFGPGTAVDMVDVGDGFVVVSSANSGTDVLLLKVGSDGTELWRQTYDGGESRREVPSTVIPTADGGFAVAGRSFISGDASTNDAFLLRTDSSGNPLQFTRYANSAGIEIVEDMVQAPDGGFVLAGRETVSGIGRGLLLKVDSTNLVWRQVFGDPGQLAFGITLAPNGYALTTADGFVLSDENGNTQSPVPYASGLRPTRDIIRTVDGGYALAGSTFDNELLLLKVDASGTELWRQVIAPPNGGGQAFSVAATRFGGYLLAGETSENGTDTFLVRLKPPGSVQGFLPQTPANDVDDTLTVNTSVEGTSTLDCEGGSAYEYYTVQRRDSTGADENTIRLYVPEGSVGFDLGNEWRITGKGFSIGCGGAGLLDPVTLLSVNTTIVDGSAVAGEPVEISLNEPVTDGITLDSITLTTTTDTDYTLAVSSSETVPSGTTELEIAGPNGTISLGYITIDESLAESDIGEVVFIFRISADTLTAAGVNPDDVVLYRYDSSGGTATALPTGNLGLDSATNEYVFEATSPGLSVFAIGTRGDSEAPVTSNVTATPNPVAIDSEVTLTATVDDSGTGNSTISNAEYSLDGGDTWQPMMVADGAFDESTEEVEVTLDPLATAQVLTICVRGTDAAGNTGAIDSEAVECIQLAVYDPSGGFVTGGGWIDSPTGADKRNPDATGKATFGFVSKYKKGANVPSGNTQFTFRAGNLDFKSTDYEWLVISGKQAQFKGSGMINGVGNYGFLLTAYDGDLQDGSEDDELRAKIIEKATDEVVYDNGATTPLGGGNIIIHKK